MLVGVGPASDLLVAEFLPGVAPDPLQPGDAVDGVDGQAEAIGLVVDGQLHRRVDVAFLLVSAHVQRLVLAGVGQAVNQPGISVEVEDDRLVGSEQRIEIRIRQPVRMFRARLQLEKVDHVDETDLQVREFLAQQRRCGERLLCRDIAGGSHDQVRLATLVVTGPVPDADALGAVRRWRHPCSGTEDAAACRKRSR